MLYVIIYLKTILLRCTVIIWLRFIIGTRTIKYQLQGETERPGGQVGEEASHLRRERTTADYR